ncbi:MAG: 3-oxoacyl-[Clostridia bacterium]|nr:3-oxoacyl-[acyl-carrier-protein] reductase [Clostridia bacterium]
MFDLKNKIAVVTGGSRGIGKAICLKMAQSGADIALIYTSHDEKAHQVEKEVSNLGRKVAAFKCNIANDSEVKNLMNEIIKKFTKIDILVNNAGICDDKLAFNMSYDSFDKVIRTNLVGTFNMIHHSYLNFVKNNSGRIINISSIVGLTGNAGQANYAASKAGIIGLTKTIAKELGRKNVTCNVIAPGFIDTDMTTKIENKNDILKNILLNEFGTPNDVANAAVFLASDEARYITGTIIKVDGGLVL